MTKAVFLDRDGVINRKASEGDYVTSWGNFHILPGVAEGISLLNRAGFNVIVVTNQRSIARGLLTIAGLEEMHERMSKSLARSGATIDEIVFCPHDYEPPCTCRKPAPGMLLEAARSRGIDLAASWMIGDSDIDIQAGKNAGCRTVRISAAVEALDVNGNRSRVSIKADLAASSLLDAVRQILQWEANAANSLATDSAAR
jgi:D-glycero-D-manno-heptose 1,7-bisphosphate phosphatase